MRHVRKFAAIVGVWLLCAAALAGLLAQVQAKERASLVDRFESRSDIGASFVGAYVEDVFKTEERLAAEVTEDTWRTSEFLPAIQLLGFSGAVLLDREGRAEALAPAADKMLRTDLAMRYPHLAAALAGTPTVSDVVSSAVLNEPVVAFALPISSGRFGVLSVGFSLASGPLQDLLVRQPIAGTRGWVLDSKGAVVVSVGPESASAQPSPARLAQSLQNPTVTGGRVVAATQVPGTGWIYVLDAPSKALLAPVSSNDLGEWAVLAALAALSLGALIAARRATLARTQARAEKAQADHRLRLTVQNAPIGMTMVDLDYMFVEPNDRLCSMLGHSAEDLATMTFAQVTYADDMELDLDFVAQLVSGEIDSYDLEKRYIRSDGSLMWGRLSVSVVRDGGVPLYFVSQIEDITDFRSAQAELEYRALYDPLTGLANRSLLLDRLKVALDDDRQSANVGVGFCDVDHFKDINDTHGHHMGDEVLKEVARRLRHAVRAGDTVARMGGDEFIILLNNVSSVREAEVVMDRASLAVKQPIDVDGSTQLVSISGGLAIGRAGIGPDTLLRNADVALYAAKEAGRGCTVVYGRSPHATTNGAQGPAGTSRAGAAPGRREEVQQARMERLIRDALDHDRIRVAYQPIFDLSSGLVVGAEALLRLTDDSGRPVPPLEVIPAAEASGQIVQVGRRVMQLAALQAATWHEEHGILLPVAVNVSAAQLGLHGFPEDVLDAVRSAGVPAHALMIELTESVLLRTGSGGMEQLRGLRDAGIELAIDDFGTGFASLSLLHELPAATTLKIDRSFVAGIPEDSRAVAIVAAVIALAGKFDMICIAEGIESEGQRTYLAERGVLGQGFLLGRPGEASVIGHMMGSHGVGAGLITTLPAHA